MDRSKFPARIVAWATKEGRYEFSLPKGDCSLFPLGEPIEYALPEVNMDAAAIIFRCPEGFEALLEGFEASTEETTRGRLYDALMHVSRTARPEGERHDQ